MAINPVGTKIYLQPAGMVLGTINDLIEMQGATVTLSDSKHGKICYSVSLYGSMREYRFSVDNIEKMRCVVKLEIGDMELDEPDKEVMIHRQFALLDSMLVINAERVFGGQREQGSG